MANEFDDRLRAAVRRINDAIAGFGEIHEERLRAERQNLNDIQNALAAWKDRIVPSVTNAIAGANAIVQSAQLELTARISLTRPSQEGRIGPPLPALPVMVVSAHPVALQSAPPAAMPAGMHDEIREMLGNFARWPRLYLEITADGKMSIRPENYPAKNRAVMAVDAFDEGFAQAAILELVEGVAPRPAR
jgi:hypothetical protein